MTTKPTPCAATATLATILQSLRAARGWTQAEVADKCGVRVATYNAWERGTSETTLSSLQAVATAFGVTVQVTPTELRVLNTK